MRASVSAGARTTIELGKRPALPESDRPAPHTDERRLLNRPGQHPATVQASSLARFAGLPLRLMVAYGFLAHGLAKWSRGPAVFASVLHSLGMPAAHQLAWATIVIEIVGGAAFLLGAFVSLVSIPAVCVLIGAIATVHLPYGFSSIKLLGVSNGTPQFGPPGFECALLYIVCIVALALMGPGPWSVDALIRRKLTRSTTRNQSEKTAWIGDIA